MESNGMELIEWNGMNGINGIEWNRLNGMNE